MAAGGAIAWVNPGGNGIATKTLGTDTRTKGTYKYTNANGDGTVTKVTRP